MKGWRLCALILCGCATTGNVTRPSPWETYRALALPSVNVPYTANDLPGHPVVITFFASYCIPCLAQVRLLELLHQKYAPKGVQIVAVGMDLEGAQVLRPFAQEYELHYPVVLADPSFVNGQSVFGPIPALPATIVLNKDGQPVGSFPGLTQEAELRRLLDRWL